MVFQFCEFERYFTFELSWNWFDSFVQKLCACQTWYSGISTLNFRQFGVKSVIVILYFIPCIYFLQNIWFLEFLLSIIQEFHAIYASGRRWRIQCFQLFGGGSIIFFQQIIFDNAFRPSLCRKLRFLFYWSSHTWIVDLCPIFNFVNHLFVVLFLYELVIFGATSWFIP